MKHLLKIVLSIIILTALAMPLAITTSVMASSATFYSSTSDGWVNYDDADYNTAWVAASGTNPAYTSNVYTAIGQEYAFSEHFIYRSFFYFDTSSLPDSATITSATLKLYGYGNDSDTDFNITVQNGQPTYPHDPLVLGDYSKANYSSDGGSVSTSSFTTSGYNTINLNATGLTWINTTGTTKLCVRSSLDIAGTSNSGNEFVLVYTSEKGSGYQPQLSVTYTGSPTVATNAVTSIGSTIATGNGNIVDTGGDNPTKRGVCWNTTGNPTISDNKTEEIGTFGAGAFSESITELSANTLYYVKAYAYNSGGYGYGSQVTFTTLGAPVVATNAATSVTSTTATFNADVTSIGSSNVTVRGFQWGLVSGNMTDNWTESGAYGIGTFSHDNTTLSANTTYYFRALAVNAIGVGYGGELSFLTSPAGLSISVITNDATNIAPTGVALQGTLQTLSGVDYCSVSFQYGSTVSYGTSTEEQSVISTGTFGAQVANLRYNTTYHFRAVARSGTSYFYGADNYFTTLTAIGSSTDLVIVSVGVFQNYMQTGDMLFTAEVINTYPGYYPSQDPKRYFTIQLLDTNDTDILGAFPLPNWGDRPVSIYVNPTQAASLIEGSSYYIRMIGTGLPTTPSVTKQITVDDWYGYDFSGGLDDWCRGVAANMQVSDGRNDYLTTLTDVGVVIDNPAGGYFSTGIPGITQERPNLFTSSQGQVTLTAGTANNVWGSRASWDTFVGSVIANDSGVIALPLGISGKDLWGGIILLMVLGCVMTVTAATGGFGALGAVLIATPLLWLGVWFNILGVIFIFLLVIAAALFWIRQFVVKTL